MHTPQKEWRKPFRLAVFARGMSSARKSRTRTEIEPGTYGIFGWTPVQSYHEARLPSAGSFLYPGIFAVRKAVMEYLAQSNVVQVQVRTNDDRKVYIWNKHEDGTITGYAPANER